MVATIASPTLIWLCVCLFATFIATVSFGASVSSAGDLDGPIAWFPFQFSADLEIIAHLVPETSKFPPRTRQMKIYYDFEAKKARADLAAGYEAAKTCIRRYDKKIEYCTRDAPINDCQRSYLGEDMPLPDASFAVFEGEEVAGDGVTRVNHFVVDEDGGRERTHLYLSLAGNKPVRLVQMAVSEDGSDTSPLLTYQYTNVVIGPPAAALFELPPLDSFDPPGECVEHIGGFPYLHIFHYYVRF